MANGGVPPIVKEGVGLSLVVTTVGRSAIKVAVVHRSDYVICVVDYVG